MHPQRSVTFSGEESSRFTRFAQFVISANISCTIKAEGRDPLTSRHLVIEGSLKGAVLDGYLRYVVVQEDGSGIEFWIAGSNSIRSVATSEIAFEFTAEAYAELAALAKRTLHYLPGVSADLNIGSAIWQRLDAAPTHQSEGELLFLLDCLEGSDEDLAREAALTLRSFSTFVVNRKSQQTLTEARLLEAFNVTIDRDTRVAIIEDLGYVGTHASIPALAQRAVDLGEEEQVRWAAGVALSRMPGQQVVEPLISLVASSAGWVAGGALLGLARHAGIENQSVLEGVFAPFLDSQQDERLQRYACLGLSRFEHLLPSTLRSLIGLLQRTDRDLGVRGFAALAISSCFTTMTAESRDEVSRAVADISASVPDDGAEPELVWGLEFLAELATLLELNGPSANLNIALAKRFDDWRSGYYSALAEYELAEEACRSGSLDDAMEHLQESAHLLGQLKGQNSADEETIRFRREIVHARGALQATIAGWKTALDADEVLTLSRDLDEVAEVYARYSRPGRSTNTAIKRLSLRETEYIRQTHRLLQVLKLAMRLDADVRAFSPSSAEVGGSVARLGDALGSLRSQATTDTPLGRRRFLEEAASIADRLRLALKLQHTEPSDLLEAASELRSAVERGTWPMPARACPVGGLGRGTIDVLKEDVPGQGTEPAPYMFPHDSPAVLNVVADLKEMAPGGKTLAEVLCVVAGQELSQRLDAVEGPVRVTFVLPNVLSPAAATRCDLLLVFSARDCQQTAARQTVYLRRQM